MDNPQIAIEMKTILQYVRNMYVIGDDAENLQMD